ncbi:MAG: hypothetical protein KAS49_07875, partial [Candidatus Cloacimonetes bacterium]|nr:hypothetical protein [Candidatus Cloacimonadota bacterium]
MKKILCYLVLMLLVANVAWADRTIKGSTITPILPYYPVGGTADIALEAFNASTLMGDKIIEASITFPQGVTVNSATNFIQELWEGVYAGGLDYDGTTGEGVTVTWTAPDYYITGILIGLTGLSTINMSFADDVPDSLTFNYKFTGEDFYGGIHFIEDSFTM